MQISNDVLAKCMCYYSKSTLKCYIYICHLQTLSVLVACADWTCSSVWCGPFYAAGGVGGAFAERLWGETTFKTAFPFGSAHSSLIQVSFMCGVWTNSMDVFGNGAAALEHITVSHSVPIHTIHNTYLASKYGYFSFFYCRPLHTTKLINFWLYTCGLA